MAESSLPDTRDLKDIIANRVTLLKCTWDRLAAATCTDPARVRLNDHLLIQAVKSYYRDLGELKARHEIDWADRHKRAGLTVKWLARTRPVQLLCFGIGADEPNESELLANELFAVFAGLDFLRLRMDGGNEQLYAWINNLLSLCRERDLDSELIASTMFLAEQLFPEAT